jgi:hypothetical protein
VTRPRKLEPRYHQVNVRVTTRELVRIHDHAARVGQTVTDFGRTVMLRRPRRRRSDPEIISLSDAAIQRWRTLGCRVNLLAHDINAYSQLDPRLFAATLTAVRLLLAKSFPQHDEPPPTYALAPAVRYHLRKVCTNLVQIADHYRLLARPAPLALPHLIRRLRVILQGDRAGHGA